MRTKVATVLRKRDGIALEQREMRKRDEADGPHRQLEDRVDEAVGQPVDADDGRAEEEAHQERVAAAVHEASDVREEHAAREAEEVARVRARKAEARPPVADRPQEEQRDAAGGELLRDERPHACAVQGERQARDASGESRDVRAHGELPELELPLEVRLLDDREPGHDHEHRHHLDHGWSSGTLFRSAHQPARAKLAAASTRHHARFTQNAESRCSRSSFSRWTIVVRKPCSRKRSITAR